MGSFENDTFVEEGGEGLKGLQSGLEEHITIGMQAVLCLTGVVGNSLVLFLFGKRGERLTYIIAILSMAVRDLIACSMLLPLCIALEALSFSTSSNFSCKSYHFIGNATYFFIMPFLVLIALDRCACVCVGQTQATYHRRAFIAVGIVSLYSVLASIVPTIGHGVHDGFCRFSPEIISFESIVHFYWFSLGAFITGAAVLSLTYATIFAMTLYRKDRSKQLIQASPLEGVGDMSSSDTESASSNAGELATSGDPEGSPADEKGRQSVKFQKEQISVTVTMFTLTVVSLIVYIPAILMAFGHIKANLVIFELHQISFVSNFVVYLCLEATFRKEVKELFQSSWSRVQFTA